MIDLNLALRHIPYRQFKVVVLSNLLQLTQYQCAKIMKTKQQIISKLRKKAYRNIKNWLNNRNTGYKSAVRGKGWLVELYKSDDVIWELSDKDVKRIQRKVGIRNKRQKHLKPAYPILTRRQERYIRKVEIPVARVYER